MMKNKIIILLILTLLQVAKITAQDYTFSQYNYAPLTINPGIISSDESSSFIFNQRSHEYINNLKYKTFQVGVFHTFLHPKNNNKSIALSASDDQIGTEGLFKHQKISLSYAQSIHISKSSFLSLGIQTEYNQKSIETENYTTGAQWIENIGFDPSLGAGETFTNENINYFNLSTGLYWYNIDRNDIKNLYAGISLYNLNKPDESFLENSSKLPLKFISNAGYVVFKKHNFSITPEVLYINFNSQHFASIGNIYSYSFTTANPNLPVNNGCINLGTRYFTNKSVSLSLQFVLESFIFGISRDIGINSQKNNYPLGGVTEFVFAFRKNFRKKEQPKIVDDNYEIGKIREFYEVDFSENFEADVEEQVTAQDTTKSYHVELKKDFKFAFNQAALDNDAKIYLSDLANLMKNDNELKLEIIGHTDNVGTKKANQKISHLRANVVAEYLLENGIAKKRLKITAKSDSDPLFPNNTRSNRAKNRRVEFIIFK